MLAHRSLKPWLALFGAVFLVFAALTPAIAQQPYPNHVGFVNDFAGVLHPSILQPLENDLRRLEEETSSEFAVVTIQTVGDSTVEEYAAGLFEDWGVGKKGQDNGVLLLVAVEERKIRIEVGYGLEPVVTDSRSGRIIREVIAPALREGDYDTGIVTGAAALNTLIREGRPAGLLEENPVRKRFSAWAWLLWPLGFMTLYMASFMARTKEVVLGTVWGAGLGAVLGLLFGSVLALALSVTALALVGLFLDWMLSSSFKFLSGTGRPTGFGQSWGGFRGAPGPWHGGGGWGGGFGGFGGGRSGGGGATGGF